MVLLFEGPAPASGHSTALPRHQQSACSKAFQRILIDHLRAPDTLTTVFFPGMLWPPTLLHSPTEWQWAPDGL